MIFPNVELRLGIETSKSAAINIHLLFSPHDPEHQEQIKRFLLGLEFTYLDEVYRCQRSDLIRLGRAYRPGLADENAARSEGANQFKVNFEQLRKEWSKNEWVKRNARIAVAGGEKDGTSGLRDPRSSFAAQRKTVEALAHIIFSANPKQIRFWLGKENVSVEALEREYNGCKPCLHGSDAHSTGKVGQPDENRFCWIKGDLRFDSIRQACIEPEDRVFIGAAPPKGALDSQSIKSVSVANAPWIVNGTIDLNPGLVAVIGSRGSGKTALVDLIAAGGLARSAYTNKQSFVHRAKQHLANSRVELSWASGEKTGGILAPGEINEPLASPHVQYLSQQFVDQLCSAEGMCDSLVEEIERVIFSAHPISDRRGAGCFKDLLSMFLEGSRQKRNRQKQALTKASADIAEERARKDELAAIEKHRDETIRSIDKDKADLNSLVKPDNDERAKRHERISEAVNVKRQQVDQAKRRRQSLLNLQDDVADFRTRMAPSLWADLMESREHANLSLDDWKSFKVDYVGPVDEMLIARLQEVDQLIAKIQGPSEENLQANLNINGPAALIPPEENLADQNLYILELEYKRLSSLIVVDQQNTKRFATLSEKIKKSESVLSSINLQIERARGADERIRAIAETRRNAYCTMFEAFIEEEDALKALYDPVKARINGADGSLSKLSFAVRRKVDIEQWAEQGESLLDLRKAGPFKGRGELLRVSREKLLSAWSAGSALSVTTAMFDFVRENESALRTHKPEQIEFRKWARSISDWLYGTDHISVNYGLQYDGRDIEQLSPGTRGIVLLMLYLALDAEDDRPLIINQPEENLDPQSIFNDLVHRFRDSKKRRQIIIVTHNANLVVNTDADQVIVANCGPHRAGQLPEIRYHCGSLENPEMRTRVCDILEGGERAFKERAKRLRVSI